jgi:hypothetical protein
LLGGGLDVLGDVDVDGLEAAIAQGAEALVAHRGVDLAEPVPFEHGEVVPLHDLGEGGLHRGGPRGGADQHEQDSGGDEDAGGRRSVPHYISDRPFLCSPVGLALACAAALGAAVGAWSLGRLLLVASWKISRASWLPSPPA